MPQSKLRPTEAGKTAAFNFRQVKNTSLLHRADIKWPKSQKSGGANQAVFQSAIIKAAPWASCLPPCDRTTQPNISRQSLGTRNIQPSAFLQPITVGLGTTITPKESGTLFFKINDSAAELDDNSGEIKVDIQ